MSPRSPRRRISLAWHAAAIVLLAAGGVCVAAEWPQWRGPLRSGLIAPADAPPASAPADAASKADLPLTWDGKTQENVLWKVPADFGHSSPIVWGDRVYLTASVRRNPKASDQIASNQQHRVACYQIADGARLWQTEIEPGPWDTQFSFTAATPVTDGKRLYALFGSGCVAAVDLADNGKLLWQRKLPAAAEGPFKAEWLSSSPLLHDGTLLVFIDVSKEHWLLALDPATGDVKWESKRPQQQEKSHNSSPLPVVVNGQVQIVVASQGAVIALDPKSDRQIWTCKWNGSRYPSLVAGPGGLVIATGEGCETLAIDPAGASGDIARTHVKWRHAKAPNGFGSPVVVGDHLYRASPPGILRCWDAADGQVVHEEPVDGIPTYTSPIAMADGRIYFASAGTSCIVKAGPKPEVLARNVLEVQKGEGGSSGPSAAVAEGKIFLRSPKMLYCIGRKTQ